MDSGATVQQEDTYTVVVYSGSCLPRQYVNMIYSKWMRSFRYGNEYIKLSDSDSYYKAYHTYITRILAQPDAQVRLAVLSENVDVVLGWSVTRQATQGYILEYVWCHSDNRRIGIATSLVPQPVTTITHLTNTGLSIWPQKLPNAVFNPWF